MCAEYDAESNRKRISSTPAAAQVAKARRPLSVMVYGRRSRAPRSPAWTSPDSAIAVSSR
jgi:hypothetical protein